MGVDSVGLAVRWNRAHRWFPAKGVGGLSMHCVVCGMSKAEARAYGAALCVGVGMTSRGWLLYEKGVRGDVVYEVRT